MLNLQFSSVPTRFPRAVWVNIYNAVGFEVQTDNDIAMLGYKLKSAVLASCRMRVQLEEKKKQQQQSPAHLLFEQFRRTSTRA
jgi:hypothetical protein